MKKVLLVCCIVFGCVVHTFGQLPIAVKKAVAARIAVPPRVDGVLDDESWSAAAVMTDFIEHRPKAGKPEKHSQRTEVRIVYDDVAVYVAARMYEENPDSIAHELVARDRVGNSDFIGIVFDTYLDRINGNGFFVTAAGVQFDAKYSQTGNEDPAWNAVWLSEVKRDRQGWTAEMKIPYSALRFSKKDVQTWGVNITRKRQFANQQSFWNHVDPQKSGFINQEGELSGIEKITPPVRLSFSPYISTYGNYYSKNALAGSNNAAGAFNGGMDVKYGINQSFTLDMTLVPDFGQVQSDNQVLNLTPFEVQFNENRQFFTEGTELFNKGDLFYSRRIGEKPINFSSVVYDKVSEHIVKNPSESRLYNASKLSGRTSSGLGIGAFNAVVRPMYAIIEDQLGNRRTFETQPLANYNILVLDQSLKNNSSVTLINTNVVRKGAARDANASAFAFSLNDKKNLYFVQGAAKTSYVNEVADQKTGYSYNLKLGKQSGKFTYNFRQELTDRNFDPNDLGILFNNNFFDNSVSLGYNDNKPGKYFNQREVWFEISRSMRYKPAAYQSFGIYAGTYLVLKNFSYIELNTNVEPERSDFYEPRSSGRVFRQAGSKGIWIDAGMNNTKRYNVGFGASYQQLNMFKGYNYDLSFYQNLRISDKFALGNDFSYEPRLNNAGWIAVDGAKNIIFSRRDRHTVENSIDAKYTFNNKMGISLIARHYWSDLKNKDFYTLQTDGSLVSNPAFASTTLDRNYNTFNIDMVYSWVFSPGSEFSIVYKDAALLDERFARDGYNRNFNKIMSSPQSNSLSFKVLYYIDYLSLRRKQVSR